MLLQVKELAERINVPVSSIYNWVQRFPWLLPLKQRRKGAYWVPEPLVPVFSGLSQLLGAGLSYEEAFRALARCWPIIAESKERECWIRLQRLRSADGMQCSADPEELIDGGSPLVLIHLKLDPTDDILDKAGVKMFLERLAKHTGVPIEIELPE